MAHPDRFRFLRAWLAASLLAGAGSAVAAGLQVHTSWTSLPPEVEANQRTVDFGLNTLAGEGSRLTYTTYAQDCRRLFGVCLAFTLPASVNLLAPVTGLLGFGGQALALNSGYDTLGGSRATAKINFTNPTPYVGFLWNPQFVSEGAQRVKVTLEDNRVVTLSNCRDKFNPVCVGAFVEQNWLDMLHNALIGWLVGDIVTHYPVYVKYQPDDGKKIKSVEFTSEECINCGVGIIDTPLVTYIDHLTYVDAAVAPHHLRITSNSNTKAVGEDVAYTVTACGNASCSLPWTSGVSGTLRFDGASPSVSTMGFTIPAGPTNSTTVTMQYHAAGTGTVGMSAHTPTPSNTPKFFCGMGVPATSGGSCAISLTQPVHHFEIKTNSASGLTCETVTYTIKACSDDACSAVLTTGASGTLMLAGATPLSSAGFTTNALGLAQVTVRTTTPGDVTASIPVVAPVPTNATRCGMGVSPAAGNSCVYKAHTSGFKFDVPNHVGGATQSVVVHALKSSDDGSRCGSAFAATEKSVALRCTSQSHAGLSGSVALQGNGTGAALGSCNAVAQTHTLKFDANGQASMTVNYAEAGETLVSASYVGAGAEVGLSMSGSDSFVTVPKTLAITASGPYVAGDAAVSTPASLSVKALNEQDQVMTAFGNEQANRASITVSKTGQSPTGPDANVVNAAIAMNSVVSGVATGSLRWVEVGTLDLSAALGAGSVYANAGVAVAGSAAAVGPFVPHHFDVEVSQACAPAGKSAFTYSGQPFVTKLKALNADGQLTLNHDGRSNMTAHFAKAATLSGSASSGANGSLTGMAVAASDFVKGVATIEPRYTFAAKASAPASITLSAAENAPGTVNSSGGSAGVAQVRSGRLFLSNAFGSGRAPLKVPAQLQYWSGKAWVLNSDDHLCSTIPSDAVILARYFDSKGAPSSAWGSVSATGFTASAGQGHITLSAPSGGATGSIDLAVNLGDTATDASCLSAHPSGGKAQRAWLRGPHGACSGAGPFDPSARATIGVFAPESSRLMHSQDLY